MNQKLLNIKLLIQQSSLPDEEKQKLLKEISNADKEWNILEFKLDRTEKVKKTTAVLLEETIEELEKKRKDVEAQNHELEIEAALERVRARAMAMHQSGELPKLIDMLFKELTRLGFTLDKCLVMIYDGLTNDSIWWVSAAPRGLFVKYKSYKSFDEYLKGWRERKSKWLYMLGGEEKKAWDNYLFNDTELSLLPQPVKDGMQSLENVCLNVSFSSFGSLTFSTLEPLPEKEFDVLMRFAKVFNQTYTRFLDLQKAEAQAREAQIEAALERVRSRAMGMQNSEELNLLIGTVFTELTKLDIVLTRCVILIYEGNEKGVRWWMANSEAPSTPMSFFVKYANLPFFNAYLKAWEERSLKWQYVLEGENKVTTDDFLFTETELSLLPDFVISGMSAPDRVYLNASFNNFGNLTLASLEPLSDEHFDILLRFAKVFDLTYTRFNDLKQAEAQAREAQIQLALERVRARTMAMQKSDELNDVATLLFKQVKDLGITTWTTGFNVWSDDNNFYTDYVTTPQGNVVQSYTIDTNKFPVFTDVSNAKKRGEKFWVQYLEGDLLKETYKQLMSFNNEEQYEKMLQDGFQFPSHQYDHFVFGSKVSLMFITYEAVTEAHDIFIRLGNVFEQTYTRFLDLKKAEAQAREADIELALERVRARTMSMQKSEELKEVIQVVYDQFVHLNLNVEHTGFIIDYKERDDMHIWLADKHEVPFEVTIPYFDCAHWNSFIEAKKTGKDFFTNLLSFEEKNKFYQDLFKLVPDVPEETSRYYFSCPALAISTALLDNVGLYIENFSGIPYTDEENKILMRLGNVFQQTYTRFLDLQKAEAQAREAQIEAALERVRNRSLAMNKSEDLKDVVSVVLQQLQHLGFTMEGGAVHIGMFNDAAKEYIQWSADPLVQTVTSYKIPYNDNPMFTDLQKAKENGEDSFYHRYSFEEKNKWFDWAFQHSDFKRLPDEFKKILLECESYSHWAAFQKNSAIIVNNILDKSLSQEQIDILKRFAKVFEQSYTRFLDLQKAEAQAREAQIEASLERVRAKAMAMQNSNDLSIAASLVFTELRKLGITPIRCGFGSLSKETRQAQLYSATSSENGDSLSLIGWVQLENHPVLEKIYDSWLQQYDYFPELRGNQLQSYYQLLLAGLSVPVPDFTNEQKQYGHFIPFSVGCLYAWSNEHYNDDQIKIFKRFATIIDLTFRRYLELQQSEANAREAIKQAALDRIRADIASMRTTSDLDRITPLIWNELTILGIPFIRCGVFIMDDEQQRIHTFLSTPDGKAIAAFHIPYNTPGNIEHVINHWHNNKNYIDHWDENAFTTFAKTLAEQGALISSEQYLQTIPHGGFYLHFLPFLQGMLYVGNTTQLSAEEINLIQSLADAFSTAYARYEDFNKLEAAKQQVDKTLLELKQAQQQLVQSEKMASLGELTAGIAHEIQNPLNFVNNFSEVSKELIDEMRTALENGDKEEAEQIANDIIQNLEKINHHGKRADAIVKNMLQHSRKNSGQKELTDINALCDEYLRLSFHGMRAKDKSFNADFKTDFDETIGKINVVPQDIGRVLLNLINNAFYAVKPPSPKGENYQPLVLVTTRKINPANNNAAKNTPLGDGGIEIIVQDNGNGIPSNIIDKIFQPFFTTKPTGEGTGLGLSLAYDIITKEHNGTIKVESKEGEGSTFIINLPAE